MYNNSDKCNSPLLASLQKKKLFIKLLQIKLDFSSVTVESQVN